MKKTWKKADIYKDKNCLQSKDLDEFDCLKAGETVHITTIIQDKSMPIHHRVWWMMEKHFTKADNDKLRAYLVVRYKELTGEEVTEREAVNRYRGDRSPFHQQDEIDAMITHMEL